MESTTTILKTSLASGLFIDQSNKKLSYFTDNFSHEYQQAM